MDATSRTMKTYTSLYVVGCVTLGIYGYVLKQKVIEMDGG